MVGMRNSSVSEKIKCQKFDKYFYRDPNGNILKYSHYCIEKNCKTESSYNYENLKPIYCNKHKLEKMVNVKRNHKLCKDCEKGYLKKCNTPKCKYTIKNYKNATRYTKQKIIKYLTNIKFVKYFYRDPNGNILKYSHYCIEKNCKTESSYNYENLKPIYCNKHKLEKMVNVKRNHKLCKDCEKGYLKTCNTPKCKYTIKNYKNATRYTKQKIVKYLKENNIAFYTCRICAQIVDKEHFETEERIEKFNSVCKIKIDKYLKDSFITIRCNFIDNRYNHIYILIYILKNILEK